MAKIPVDTTIEFVAYEYRKRAIDKATASEKLFKQLLDSLNVMYEFQDIFYYYDENRRKTFYLLDFRLYEYNIIFEIDGQSHQSYQTETNDKIRDMRTKKAGYITHRITNNQLFKDYEVTLRTVARLLGLNNAITLVPQNKPKQEKVKLKKLSKQTSKKKRYKSKGEIIRYSDCDKAARSFIAKYHHSQRHLPKSEKKTTKEIIKIYNQS